METWPASFRVLDLFANSEIGQPCIVGTVDFRALSNVALSAVFIWRQRRNFVTRMAGIYRHRRNLEMFGIQHGNASHRVDRWLV
jgi:hypothetical protein